MTEGLSLCHVQHRRTVPLSCRLDGDLIEDPPIVGGWVEFDFLKLGGDRLNFRLQFLAHAVGFH